MKPKTIKTDQRVFQVKNFEGDLPYLCNLEHLNLSKNGSLLGADKEHIVQIRHIWNGKLKVISKLDVKNMILSK